MKKSIIPYAVITLGVFVLATALNVGINVYDSITKRDIRLQGSAAHVEVLSNAMSIEQLTYIYGNLDWRLDYVETTHANSYIGQAINDGQGVIEMFSAVPFSMTEWRNIFRPAYTNITGRYPEARNEIMASRHALELLGVDNPKIGMEVEISYDLSDLGTVNTQTFILSGFFTDYTHFADRPTRIYCSRPFSEAARMNVVQTEENKEALRAASAKHGISVLFEGGVNVEENIERLKRDFNLADEQIRIYPAFSGAFDNINANVFALDFYPAIYVGAAVLAVIIIAVIGIANMKKVKRNEKGGK